MATARPVAALRRGRNDWYRITNRGDGATVVYIYDEIGYFGVTASDFVRELAAVTADTIDLHINSPGGDVFDGIAIYNAIRNHPATVTSFVDGLAASAASFIAMAGDVVVVARNATMMIHDGHGICVGNATDMRELANLLDQTSDNIASIYAERAGGTVSEWRAAMREVTWYSAQGAVDAGLADEVKPLPSDDQAPINQWDLSIFGRSTIPAPADAPPAVPAAPPVTPVAPVVDTQPEPPAFEFDPEIFRSAIREVAS